MTSFCLIKSYKTVMEIVFRLCLIDRIKNDNIIDALKTDVG